MSAFTLVEGDVTLRSGGIETAASDGVPLVIGTRGYIGVGFDGTTTRFIRVDSIGRTIIVGPDAPGASYTGNPVVAAGVDIGGFVRQLLTDSSGRQRAVGAADHGSPIAGFPVLVAGSDGTNAYRLLTDTAGRLQVNIAGGGSGTSSSYGAVFPATGTAAGFFDGTNMQGARVFDLDTGGGTEWDLGVSIRLPGAGGSVVGGTLSDPIRIDPTGTTAQPVSGTVTANQGTAAATAGAWPTKVTDGTNTAAVKAASTAPLATDPALVVAISPNSSVTATNPSVGTNNTAIPASSTQVGGSDGTNLQPARVFDADTGAGTQYVLGAILRKSASGGSVEAGTSIDPLRTDPTGTTAQPVTDNGGSLTVDTPQLPGALIGGRLDSNVGAWLGSTAPTVGQKTMANSVPVVLPSDQTIVATTTLYDAAENPVSTSPATLLPAELYRVQVKNAGSPDLRVDGSGTPVDFDVPADGTNDIWIDEIRVTMTSNPVDTDGAHFGPVTTLTNGLRIQVRSNGVTTDLANMQITEDFLAYSSREAARIDRSGSKDTLVAGWYLGGIVKLLNGSGDFVRVTVRDNLTSVKFLYLTCTVHGIKKAP